MLFRMLVCHLTFVNMCLHLVKMRKLNGKRHENAEQNTVKKGENQHGMLMSRDVSWNHTVNLNSGMSIMRQQLYKLPDSLSQIEIPCICTLNFVL